MCRSRVRATAVLVAACCFAMALPPRPASAGRVDSSPPPADVPSSRAGFAPAGPSVEFLVELRENTAPAATVDSGVVARPIGNDTTRNDDDDVAPSLPPAPDDDDAAVWTAIAEDLGREPEPVRIDWGEVHAEALPDGPPLIPLPTGAMTGLVGLGGLALIRLLRNPRRWFY